MTWRPCTYKRREGKKGQNQSIFRAGVETLPQSTDLWTWERGKERVGWTERAALKHTLCHM